MRAETNRKMVKEKGQQLAQRLRHMSRTKHRGGVHPNLKEQQQAAVHELQPPRRGKVETVVLFFCAPVIGLKPGSVVFVQGCHSFLA